LKFEIKTASKFNLAGKTKKTHMFSHFEKSAKLLTKEKAIKKEAEEILHVFG
jgi:hypothetical protein